MSRYACHRGVYHLPQPTDATVFFYRFLLCHRGKYHLPQPTDATVFFYRFLLWTFSLSQTQMEQTHILLHIEKVFSIIKFSLL
jgi:hypothetical protein